MRISVFSTKTGGIIYSVWTWGDKVCVADAYSALTHNQLTKEMLEGVPEDLRNQFVEFYPRISDHQVHCVPIYWCDGDKIGEVIEALITAERPETSASSAIGKSSGVQSVPLPDPMDRLKPALDNFTMNWKEHHLGQIVSEYADLMQKIASNQDYTHAVTILYPAAASNFQDFQPDDKQSVREERAESCAIINDELSTKRKRCATPRSEEEYEED